MLKYWKIKVQLDWIIKKLVGPTKSINFDCYGWYSEKADGDSRAY